MKKKIELYHRQKRIIGLLMAADIIAIVAVLFFMFNVSITGYATAGFGAEIKGNTINVAPAGKVMLEAYVGYNPRGATVKVDRVEHDVMVKDGTIFLEKELDVGTHEMIWQIGLETFKEIVVVHDWYSRLDGLTARPNVISDMAEKKQRIVDMISMQENDQRFNLGLIKEAVFDMDKAVGKLTGEPIFNAPEIKSNLWPAIILAVLVVANITLFIVIKNGIE